MRLFLFIFAFLMLGLVVSIAAKLVTRSYGSVSRQAIIQIVEQAKRELKDSSDPVFHLAHSAVSSTFSDELIYPSTVLPATQNYPHDLIVLLNNYGGSCDSKFIPESQGKLGKAFTWHRFLCRELVTLPTDFFSKPPYIHPFGYSYSYRAIQKGIQYPVNFAVKKFIHVSEVSLLSTFQTEGIPGSLLKLGDLSSDELAEFLGGAVFLIGSKYVFLREDSPHSSDQLAAYPKAIFSEILASSFGDKKIKLMPWRGDCQYREGRWCWVVKSKWETIHGYSNFFMNLFSLSLVLFAIIAALYSLLRLYRNEQEKTLALRVLSHELRTPVTALKLCLDNLFTNFSNLRSDQLESMARIGQEVARLERTVENSTVFLRTTNSNKSSLVNCVHFSSANELLGGIVSDISNKIKFDKPKDDFSLVTDHYWLSVCLKNLIENALVHGKHPISVSWTRIGNTAYITVTDAGMFEQDINNRLFKPFIRGNKSKGLGLGLAITRRILFRMQGSVDFKYSPTRAVITLRDIDD